jgi:hypothetical protein
LFSDEVIFSQSNEALAAGLARIARAPDGSLRDVHGKAAAYREWTESDEHRRKRLIADAWCAAFVWIKHPDAPPAIVNRVFANLQEKGSTGIPPETLREIERLRREYDFFHWHLEFPDIFHVYRGNPDADEDTGWSGGFTCVLANPPWDRLEFEDKKYFSVVDPSIAELAGAKLHTAVAAWLKEDSARAERYQTERRKLKATSMFASSAGAFPLCAKGLTAGGVTKLQVDQLFAEWFTTVTAPVGRAGCIVPSAIATGAGGQFLYGDLTARSAITSLYDFDNRKPLFPAVHSSYKLCLLSLTGNALREPAARYAFFLLDPADLDNPDRVFTLAPEEIDLLSPNTRTPPIFRTRRDAELTIEIYRRIPVLCDETQRGSSPWNISFKYMFRSANDAEILRTREDLEREGWRLEGNVFNRGEQRMLPMYEAKMIDFFNHRAADVVKSETAVNRQNQPRYLGTAELEDPSRLAIPMFWIAEEGPILVRRTAGEARFSGVSERLAEARWERDWLCGWRDVTASTNERTAIPALIPRAATLHKFPLMFPRARSAEAAALVAAQSSLVFDYVSRQKIGGVTMSLFIWKQLPVPTPTMLEPYLPFITPRVLELVYTAYDMTPLARDLGDDGEPFVWDEDRRALLRAELDAFFFRLYGIDERDDVDYILETFQTETGGLKHNEIAKYGTYRTKALVLDAYDRMRAAETAGRVYETSITPPPGQGPRHPAQAPS